MIRFAWMLPIALLLTGCDQLSERAGFTDPAKLEADGKAIGGACRHAGRGLEDCYRLNKAASKAAIFAGWKEMNEYMIKNNMQTVEPAVPISLIKPPKKSEADGRDALGKAPAEAADKAADKDLKASGEKKLVADPVKDKSKKH